MSVREIKLNNKHEEIEVNSLEDLSIEIDNNSTLDLKLLNFNKVDNLSIKAKVGKDSYLNVTFADFSKGNISLKTVVDLVSENASCDWHLATLGNDTSEKHFDISFNHLVGNTTAVMNNYGVARDKSRITFSGVNHILEHASKSKTVQNAKIIVFDKDAYGQASPILKIDENDVQASHAAIVGQLNNNHMFYLMSRGLTKKEAKLLITLGYLQPISKNFSKENRELIENAIKEAM